MMVRIDTDGVFDYDGQPITLNINDANFPKTIRFQFPPDTARTSPELALKQLVFDNGGTKYRFVVVGDKQVSGTVKLEEEYGAAVVTISSNAGLKLEYCTDTMRFGSMRMVIEIPANGIVSFKFDAIQNISLLRT